MCKHTYCAREEVYKGYTIHLIQDEDAPHPRVEFDHLFHIVGWHRRWNFGDNQLQKHYTLGEMDLSWMKEYGDFKEWYEEHKEKVALIAPVFMYEHGGATISLGREYPFNDQWDAGQVGFIFVMKDELLKEYSVKRLTIKTLAKARKVMEAEIEEYDQFLTGDVYGFVIEDPNGDEFNNNSVWGFFGWEYALEEAKSVVNWEVKEREGSKWEAAPQLEHALSFGGA